MKETANWPYNFPQSPDFLHSNQRGSVSGQLSIRDGYGPHYPRKFLLNFLYQFWNTQLFPYCRGQNLMPAAYAYVGLALPGNAGSWEYENKVNIFMFSSIS